MAGKHRADSKIRQFFTYWNSDEAPKSKSAKNVVKFRRHVVCIVAGLGLAIGSTYLGGLALHIAPALPILPSMAQEAIDRIRDL